MAAKNISNRNEAITFMMSNDALENDLSVDIFIPYWKSLC